jgi:Zn finger protein HypA/HybF involved in hydrogenase expression
MKYSYRCTNPKCPYYSFTREDIESTYYGNQCSNCIGYVENQNWCLICERITSHSMYCSKYELNEERKSEITRYCEHCGSETYRVPGLTSNQKINLKKDNQWNYIPGGRFRVND